MNIKKNISLALYTTLKTGGAARFFCEAKDEKEILEALKFAREKKLPVFVLGGGSNILVSDKGFEGVVIRIRNSQLVISDSDIICDSGCQLSKAVSESVKAGLTGLEWAAGIPGTVGGAIRGNAGAFGSCIAEVIDRVKVIDVKKSSAKSHDELGIMDYELGDCGFDYRESVFKQNPNLIILSATLNLKKGSKLESEKRVKEIIKQRKEAQPPDFPSSGSFFKNPETKSKKLLEEFKKDTGDKVKNNIIPAGYLIDRVGLRGKKIGGAMVSEKHANFIVNTENATAENVVMLAAIIKTKVRNKFGIQLQEEVQMVGF